jgi:hypothetical protein
MNRLDDRRCMEVSLRWRWTAAALLVPAAAPLPGAGHLSSVPTGGVAERLVYGYTIGLFATVASAFGLFVFFLPQANGYRAQGVRLGSFVAIAIVIVWTTAAWRKNRRVLASTLAASAMRCWLRIRKGGSRSQSGGRDAYRVERG